MDNIEIKNSPIRTKFIVFPDYEFIDIDGERFIQPLNVDEIKNNDIPTIISENKILSTANLKNIYSYLAKVKDEESLLNFIRVYGMLGITSKKVDIFPDAVITLNPDNVKECLRMASNIKWLLNAWNDAENIPDKVNIGGHDIEYYKEFIMPLVKSITLNKKFDKKSVIKIYVARRSTFAIEGLKPAIRVTPNGNIIPTFSYSTLHDAIWHQLYLDVIKDSGVKTCPYCQSIHTGSGRFCPSPPHYSRSPCENKYRQTKFRKMPTIKDMLSAGHSILEISKKVRLEPYIVESFLRDEKDGE